MNTCPEENTYPWVNGPICSQHLQFRKQTYSISRPIMSSQRVKSKNLFNFRPQGCVDEDIVAFYEKMKTDFNVDMVEWGESLKDQSESDYVAGMRGMMDGMMVRSPFGTDPTIVGVGEVSSQSYNSIRRMDPVIILSFVFPLGTMAALKCLCLITRQR